MDHGTISRMSERGILSRFAWAVALMTANVTAVASADENVVVVSSEPGKGDGTNRIQNAVDSGATEVVIPYIGRPWVVEPIRLRNNVTLRFEPGVVLLAKEGSFLGKHDSMLVLHEVDNVHISGYGATLRMRRDDYRGDRYEKGEWRHGVDMKGSSRITVEGLTIEESGGDGVYVGPTWDNRRVHCRNIKVVNCVMKKNYRQGMSIISGENVLVENCVFRDTGGTNPQAGLDIEPGSHRDKIVNIHVKNCRSINNVGSGFLLPLVRSDKRSSPVSVLIENCLADGSQSHLVAVNVGERPCVGQVVFRNCTFKDTNFAGLRGQWDSVPDAFQLRFENCRWMDVAKRYNRSPFSMDLTTARGESSTAGVFFSDSILFDDRLRRVLDVGKAGQAWVNGRVRVVSPRGARSEGNLNLEDAGKKAGLEILRETID